ncbi:phosphate-starvation-inducible PsiE family protein [Nitrospira sp. NS4]|uniref:phosphate-starvation-inducible PsiE family protein n=1 Tax=Nitrospira sp. NS4 TaxID=3414498 RepID=UPI003C2DF9C1
MPAWLQLRFPKPGREAGPSDLAAIWEKGTQLVLSLLIVTILVGLAGGVMKTFIGLRLLWTADLEIGLRHLIVSTLTLLAVVEVLKTTLAYFSEGRVRVTFIVDTVLVVMLTEVISLWFTGGEWEKLALLAGILLTLGLIRVVAVRFSPAQPAQAGQTQPPGLSLP